ncbi:MFS transporter [Pararobbsia silviterrae]|nr:MFS transporter [Pararobbsia silviterrae]
MNTSTEEVAVSRKVYARLVWFLVLMFICSYLDRINMSFAALSMNRDLGLTATSFGIAGSVFYLAYVVAEIPSNLAMQRLGARLWIPRIMITWGLASAACMFATGPSSLYVFRALVGLAEAGFMPGVLLYLTYWFPEAYRARASTLFIMAQPITILFGSSLSGALLEMNGFMGLAGWRWLFLIEGVPSIALGIVAFFYLDNRPSDAKWLSDEEKVILRRTLERDEERLAKLSGHTTLEKRSLGSQIFSAPVVLLALCYFGLVMSLNTNSTWVPQIVHGLIPHASLFHVGLIAAIPSLVAIVAMTYWGAHSDRRGERAWHVVIPMCVAALGWLGVALLGTPSLRFVGLILSSCGTFAAQAIFWTLAPRYLSESARPVGIAAINVVGMIGTAAAPAIVGVLHDLTGGFRAGLGFVAISAVAGAACIVAIRFSRHRVSYSDAAEHLAR